MLLALAIPVIFCPIRLHAFPFQVIGRDGILRSPSPITGRIFVSADAARKMVSKRIGPDYPAAAQAEGLQGAVVLKVIVGEDGRVSEATCTSGPRALCRAATDAVKRWEYQKFLLNDYPVIFETRVTLRFRLQNAV